MNALLDRLKGGDRRSIGASNAIVRDVLAAPERFADIIAGLADSDPIVRLRCADAAEKITARHADWLAPHKRALLRMMGTDQPKEIKWHLAQMSPRLVLSEQQRSQVITVLFCYLEDDSRIVQTFALQALSDLAQDDPALRRSLKPIIERAAANGSPALKSRARKLLAKR